jgi:parallel beta-helix repeat protein
MGKAMVGNSGTVRFQVIVIAVLFLLPAISLSSEGAEVFTPIVVEGDGGFVAAGFSGSGTSGDPYVLSDVYVNATGHHQGIFISNTTKHFVITDCRTSDAYTSDTGTLDLQESGSGILLYNVSNGTIENTVADYNARGITICACHDIMVTNCTLDNDYRTGVYIVDCSDTDIVISDCDITASDISIDIGVLVQDSSDVSINGNDLSLATEAGVCLSSTTTSCKDNTVADNTISGPDGTGITMSGSIAAEDNIVQGNSLLGISGPAIRIEAGTSNDIIDNLISDCDYGLFLLSGADGNQIVDNTVTGCTYGARFEAGANGNVLENDTMQDGVYGTYVRSGDGISVRNCSIINMSTTGIDIGTDVTNATIVDNFIQGCGWGIRAVASSGQEIEGLEVTDDIVIDSSIGGLYLSFVTGSRVLGNTFHNASGNGLYLGSSCDDVDLQGNTFTDNGLHGLVMHNADGNDVIGNLFRNNTLEGIYLDSGTGNIISENVFLYNNGTTAVHIEGRSQAFSANALNSWYSIVGNHWSDWTSPDENSDGTVDSPYIIGPSGIDQYPLTSIIGSLSNVQAIGLWHSVRLNWTLPEHVLVNELQEIVVTRDGGPTWTLDGDAEGLLDETASPNTTYSYDLVASNGIAEVTSQVTVSTPDVSSLLIITAPQEGEVLRYEGGTLSWEVSGLNVSYYSVSLDDGTFINVGADKQYQMDLADGTHQALVRATFSNATYLEANVSFTVSGYPPSVAFLSPINGSYLSSSEVFISWFGAEGASSIASYSISVDGNGWEDVGLVNSTTLDLAEGAHLLLLKAIDSSGRESTAARMNVTVDMTSPDVTGSSPQGEHVVQGSNVSITFSEVMRASSVNVTMNGVSLTGAWGNLTYTLSMELEYNTEYIITVDGEDRAGNALTTFQWSFETEVGNATLSGRLVSEDGKSLSGAKVICGDAIAYSDGNGNFSILLSPGNRTLIVSMDGYQDEEVTVEVIPGQDQGLGDISLERSSGMMLYIVVIIIVAVICAIGLWLWRRKK